MTNEKLYEMISFALNDNAIQTESIFNELIEDIVEDTLVDMQKEIFSEARTKEPGNETDAHELHLFATNDGDLYRRGATPIINNLKRKVKKGVYDHEKAVKLWKYHADNASKKYTKEVAGERHQTHLFSPATRELAARKMADYYKEDVHDSHHANESVEENIKMDIHVDGKYHSSTTQSKTNKEAKEKFLKAFPQHQGKKIQVTRVNESIDFTEIEEGFAGVKHSGGPLQGKIDKRYSITKEYDGHSSARHVARFAGDYLGSHESREGAQEIAQKHSDLRDRIHSGIHENAIEMGLDLTEDQIEDIVEETLNELSKKTLVKYISKSAVNIHHQGMRRQLHKDKEDKDLEKHTTKKAGDRLKGIQRATLKLANENVDQEDSLDEVASNKFVNVATSRKAIRDTQKILNDNPNMMSGHKAEFKRTITIHKKHLEKAGHPFNENIEMEEAVHPADAHRILNSMGGKDADYFTLKSQHLDTLEDERKKAKYSGSNSLGRGKTRQFFYHLQKQAAKYKPYKANESFDMEEETLDELSKKTLGNYVNAAAYDKSMASFKQGKAVGNAGAYHKRPDKETANKEAARDLKREKGIGSAIRKLTGQAKVNASESVDIEQNKLIQMAGVKKKSKDTTTAIASNGDFVVHDRGTVIGRLKKGTWEHHAPSLREYVEDRESNESVDIEESKKSYIATIKHTRTGEIRKVKFRTSRSPRVEASTKLLKPLEYLHSIDSIKE